MLLSTSVTMANNYCSYYILKQHLIVWILSFSFVVVPPTILQLCRILRSETTITCRLPILFLVLGITGTFYYWSWYRKDGRKELWNSVDMQTTNHCSILHYMNVLLKKSNDILIAFQKSWLSLQSFRLSESIVDYYYHTRIQLKTNHSINYLTKIIN